MINYKYDQEAYAKIIEEKGFQSQYHKHELRILAKYYKWLDKKPKQRSELLYQFCKDKIKQFNEVLYFMDINSALNHAKNKHNNLIVIKEISVTRNEIEYINDMKMDDIFKKVVFTLLVINKLNREVRRQRKNEPSKSNYYGGTIKHYKELFDSCKIPERYKEGKQTVKVDMNKVVNQLEKNGIIAFGNKGTIILSFVDKIATSEEIAMKITTFDNIGYYLDAYNGVNKITDCKGCGRLIRLSGNRKKYCCDCASEKQQEQKKQWKRDNSNMGEK